MLSALGAESFNFDNFRYLVAGLALGFAAWVAVRGLRRAGWLRAHRLIGFAGPAFAVGVALRIGDWRAIVPWLGVLAACACVGTRRPPRGGAAVVIGVIAAVFLGVQRGASQVLPLALIPLAAWLLADVAFRWPAPVTRPPRAHFDIRLVPCPARHRRIASACRSDPRIAVGEHLDRGVQTRRDGRSSRRGDVPLGRRCRRFHPPHSRCWRRGLPGCVPSGADHLPAAPPHMDLGKRRPTRRARTWTLMARRRHYCNAWHLRDLRIQGGRNADVLNHGRAAARAGALAVVAVALFGLNIVPPGSFSRHRGRTTD